MDILPELKCLGKVFTPLQLFHVFENIPCTNRCHVINQHKKDIHNCELLEKLYDGLKFVNGVSPTC